MDRVVTLFGGGGFLGRYVAQTLLKAGARLRIAQRNPRAAFFLQPLGAMGQIQFIACDLRDAERVRAVTEGSDAVVNLAGVLRGDFNGIHARGAGHVAAAAAAAGARALVHVSAIGADARSESLYYSSKGEGEQSVRAAFPQATVIRPSALFGREDNFINRFAGLARHAAVLPVVRGDARFQPVYVADVGRAIAAAALDPATHAGKTYELGGPEVMTMREVMQFACRATGRDRALVDLPDFAAAGLARMTGWLPGAPLSWHQWQMLQKDNVVAGDADGLEAFGISKTPMAAVADGWLTAFRRHGRFAGKSPY